MSGLRPFVYDSAAGAKSFKVLDQLKIPSERTFIEVKDVNDAWKVIRDMNVRGAPLIALTAALGLSVEINGHALGKDETAGSGEAAAKHMLERMDYLRTARPTAVNLFNAMDDLGSIVRDAANGSASGVAVAAAFTAAAEKMVEDDLADNKGIGRHGAEAILARTGKSKVKIMTVCNAGSLATGGYGTALGVVRALHERGALEEVVALETRPYNQGSRLTAFEIMEDEMPGCLITDNMAATYMKRKGCDAVVTGADRVCRNGDTANKIGTYMLAVLCRHHGIPFYVAAPVTTLDLVTEDGDGIKIEERKASELLDSSGAPKNMPVWNPAFDVTPAELIQGVVTEVGVVEKEDGAMVMDCEAFVKKHAAGRGRRS